MSEEPFEQKPQDKAPERPEQNPRRKQEQLVFPVPRNLIYATVAVVVFSVFITFFVRNPYTQASTEGSLYYERGMETNMALWVAIFIGIPASFLAYKHWILPLLERRGKNRRR